MNITSSKAGKFRTNLDIVLKASFVLDDMPDDPREWTEQQQVDARAAILTLGAPESFLRRFARAELPEYSDSDVCSCPAGNAEGITERECVQAGIHETGK